MKRTFLILAAMFLVLDCSWAEEKDAEKFLLSGNHAKSFLKRQDSWDICDELFYKARPYDINAECCDKACDSEEFEETTDPYDDNDYLQNYNRETKRELYVCKCCK